ncbi:hypothetical protein CANINC_004568 [Pichia inconspicua]|uniref:Phosphotransferase n=1 Tax=Pichia inconspicua TaxID=52247 RepID=A0A4T0WVN2_9ASCO|nr:hypothetical protein CANINC_004568 [[Candida] inconspicua]
MTPLIEAFLRTSAQLEVRPQLLRELTNLFLKQMHIGLTTNSAMQIPMIVTWVLDKPDGSETGEYLAIDLGGTNLRIIKVTLTGDFKYTSVSEKYAIPNTVRIGTARNLFMFIAKRVDNFVKTQFKSPLNKKLPLGFTFSYAAKQDAINHGVLKSWSKGFDVDGVEGNDVVELLQNALDELETPVDVIALINDTTGTLVASMYCDSKTVLGCIFGTGINGAYYERMSNVGAVWGKQGNKKLCNDPLMAINCEYGAFDNNWMLLPRTKYDIHIDVKSPRPGEQLYEKMVAGYYLGELLRLILLDYHSQGLIFVGQKVDKLMVPYSMDTSFPSNIEKFSGKTVGIMFKKHFQLNTTIGERAIIYRLCTIIGTRAARLSAVAVAALLLKQRVRSGNCACDGSVFNKYPLFRERVLEAVGAIYGVKSYQLPFNLTHAEDGSGVGAAIIACLTERRLREGKSVGVHEEK